MNETQVIEIGGIKMEVDMRYAKRIDTLKVGSKVKLLMKQSQYGGAQSVVYAGVVVGFEPFDTLPTIIVCYLEVDYSSASVKFAHVNANSREKYELVASIDNDLPVQKADILAKMEREIEKKREEIADLSAKRSYFLAHFNQYFEPESA